MRVTRSFVITLLSLAGAAFASDSTPASCDTCGPRVSFPAARAVAGSTDRNYCTDFERVKEAAIEALEEEAHLTRDKIDESSDEGCSCGELVYLKTPYIDFSRIKVKIDGRGKDSGMPELSVTITTDKTFFTRHKEWEQRIHELVLLKLKAVKHGEESRVIGLIKNAKGSPKDAPPVIPAPAPQSTAPVTTPPAK